jgi:protein gp37
VEDQANKKRIDVLREIPAAHRFISLEPLLEDIGVLDLRGISQVIIGGESGHNARPFDIAWVRSVVRQCRDAHVACFVKQMGSRAVEGLRRYGAAAYSFDRSVALKSSHGSDPSEWPEDLRVREFPDGVSNGK